MQLEAMLARGEVSLTLNVIQSSKDHFCKPFFGLDLWYQITF
jgi:hypothetical protein